MKNILSFAISVLLIASGMGVFGMSVLSQSQTGSIASAVSVSRHLQPESVTAAAMHGIPRHISIKALNIDTNVLDGTYDASSATWAINEESAFYATITDEANDTAGNTFIYGHNSDAIFGNLRRNIPVGTVAIVTTDNGYEFLYRFTGSEVVKPTAVNVLSYSGKPRLTLQTCTGIWNQSRQMVYFDFISVRAL